MVGLGKVELAEDPGVPGSAFANLRVLPAERRADGWAGWTM